MMWIFVLLAAFLTIQRFSQNILRLWEYGKWDPPGLMDRPAVDETGRPLYSMETGERLTVQVPEFTDVPDMGIEVNQPLMIAMSFVLMAVFFSTLVATFVERLWREDAFPVSRFFVAWLAVFWAVVTLTGEML